MNVLVIGGGAREHALAWRLARAKAIREVYVAPGNGGTAREAKMRNVPISATEVERLVRFAWLNHVGLTVVGPENALAAGVVDRFRACGLRVFGPTRAAARIETSKAYAKRLMTLDADVPTAPFVTFTDPFYAIVHVRGSKFPMVVKLSGLAAGKGVYVCRTLDEAEEAICRLGAMKSRMADWELVIEQFTPGHEVSAHAICDGKNFQLFPFVRDYKRLGIGNTGPNTGGMGAIAPVRLDEGGARAGIPVWNIVESTLDALACDEAPFTGVLYPGLMIGERGPSVLEFNARFGDPEAQVYMRLFEGDFAALLAATDGGDIRDVHYSWRKEYAACVVIASRGYPGAYQTGFPIEGIEAAEEVEGVKVFHAGTKIDENGRLVTAGGRILSVTATASTMAEAVRRAYEGAKRIRCEGAYMRPDIGS